MKKLVAVLLVLALLGTAVFAQGSSEAKSDKVKIGALIRNLNEQFVKDYADNLRKLAA